MDTELYTECKEEMEHLMIDLEDMIGGKMTTSEEVLARIYAFVEKIYYKGYLDSQLENE